MTRRASTAILVTLLLGARSASTHAAGPNQTPVVVSATVSVDGSTLFVDGSGFGSTPSVSLGGFTLGGVAVNILGTELTGVMPALPPGSYALIVQSGNNRSVAFEIAVGPSER